MLTIFANVLNIRMTPTELVIEVGSFFPDRPHVGPPSDYKPEVRVVLNKAVLPGLAEALKQAVVQGEAAAKATTTATTSGEQQKRNVGFNG